jgi:hypothetical protein
VAERISLVVTTDVLSEGLDLQQASVVVHLDLPWNPARLEQRVGRVRRIGSPHPVIHAYVLAPPAATERLLRVEERLRQKLAVAAGVVGSTLPILPLGPPAEPAPGRAEAVAATLRRIAGWRSQRTAGAGSESPIPPLIAAVRSERCGFLALVEEAGEPLLVADAGSGLTTEARAIADVVGALEGEPLPASVSSVRPAADALIVWWRARRGRHAVGLHTTAGARARARLSARLDALLAAAPRHERTRLAPLVSRARLALRAPLGAAAERTLLALGAEESGGEQWLRALGSLAERCADRDGDPARRRMQAARDGESARGEASSRGNAGWDALPLVVLVVLGAECESAPSRARLRQRDGVKAKSHETRPRPDP